MMAEPTGTGWFRIPGRVGPVVMILAKKIVFCLRPLFCALPLALLGSLCYAQTRDDAQRRNLESLGRELNREILAYSRKCGSCLVYVSDVPLSPATLQIVPRAEEYFRNRYGSKASVKSRGLNHVGVEIKGLKGEVIEASGLWESLEVYVVVTKDHGVALHIAAAGYYAAGSGRNNPPRSAFRDMEPQYHDQVSSYVAKVSAELQEHINRAR